MEAIDYLNLELKQIDNLIEQGKNFRLIEIRNQILQEIGELDCEDAEEEEFRFGEYLEDFKTGRG